MLFNKKESDLAMILATNFGHKTARNQVIAKVVIIVNISCMLNLHQASLYINAFTHRTLCNAPNSTRGKQGYAPLTDEEVEPPFKVILDSQSTWAPLSLGLIILDCHRLVICLSPLIDDAHFQRLIQVQLSSLAQF